MPIGAVVAEGEVGKLSYEVKKVEDRRFRRLRLDQQNFDVRFHVRPGSSAVDFLIEAYETIYEALAHLHQYLQTLYSSGQGIQMQWTMISDHFHPNLQMPIMDLDYDRAVDDLMYRLEEILNSNDEIPLDDSFRIAVIISDIPPLRAAGKQRRKPKLGPLFHHQDAISKSPFLQFPPEFEGLLKECCLLVSLVLGLKYNEELRACKTRLGRKGTAYSWKILQHLHCQEKGREDRARRARQYLHDEVLALCREHGWQPQEFSQVSLASPGLREKVDQLGINLHIYAQAAGYKMVFSHPHLQDTTKATVSLLVVNNPVQTGVLHCGLIKQPGKFFSRRGRRVCLFCHRSYINYYFKFHKCPKRQQCSMCRLPLIKEDDYVDYAIRKEHCLSLYAPQVTLSCESCKRTCYTKACFDIHKSHCKTLRRCDDCGTIYRIGGKNQKPHECGDKFCVQCKKHHNEYQGRHVCELGIPKEQDVWQRLVAFDVETWTDELGRHHVVAVGFTWEDAERPGVFHEQYFFDDDMQHPEDGEIQWEAFKMDYWPKWMKKVPHLKPPKNYLEFDPCTFRHTAGPEDKEERPVDEDGAPIPAEVASFLDNEAAEGGDEEEEEGEEDWEDTDFSVPKETWRDWVAEPDEDEQFMESTALNKFVQRLLRTEFYGCVVMSHNGAGFDNMLLLRTLLRRKIDIEPVFDGSRLLCLKVPLLKLTFTDSYRYIKLPLAAFPSRFPSVVSQVKGVFPFKFIKKEHYDYCEDHPPGKEWFLDKFSTSEKIKTVKKYLKKFQGQWSFKTELKRYLEDDVRLLRGGLVATLKEYFDFQDEMKRRPDLPFHAFSKPYFTMSSFVYALFRYYSLEPGQVYLSQNQFNACHSSKKEMEWLSYIMWKTGCSLMTNFSDLGQRRIGRFSIDGFDVQQQECFEFLGCQYHGHVVEDSECPLSKDQDATAKTPFGRTFHDVHKEWLFKKKCLQKMGLKVEYMWECCWDEEKQINPDVRTFLTEHYKDRPTERLRIRDGLRGGRCEAFALSYDAEENPDRDLYYADVSSLYPYIATRFSFPVGLPSIYLGERLKDVVLDPHRGFVDTKLDIKVTGLAQVKVLAPSAIFIPCLAVKSDGKLVYGLCRTCMEEKKKDFCQHTDEERAITDVWCTPELEYACTEAGYRLLEVYEMHLFHKTAPIFQEFFMGLARIKLQGEGFPSEAVTQEEKQAYVDKLNKDMPGLNLLSKDVKKNLPRRQFGKLLSNVGLGKMSQNSQKASIEYCSNWYQISLAKHSPKTNLLSIIPISPYMAEVKTEPKASRAGFHRNVAPIIYSFVTSLARLKVLKDMRALQKLGARIYYMDTDSLFFSVSKATDMAFINRTFNMESNSYGGYTYEEPGPISKFVSLGSKNYSYVVKTKAKTLPEDHGQEDTQEDSEDQDSGSEEEEEENEEKEDSVDIKQVVKVRGFSLRNKQARKVINHKAMKEALQHWLDNKDFKLETEMFTMKVDRHAQTVTSKILKKAYKNNTFTKRWVPKNHDHCVTSYPYGTKHAQFTDLV